MTLLALAKTLREKALSNDTGGSGDPIGTLTFETPYEQLHYAEVDGIGTVTIDKSGNMIGFSPVERCKHNGETAWLPTELCKNLRLEPFPVGIMGATSGLPGTPVGSLR